MAQTKAYLLDTHIFIWWMTKSPRLNEKTKKIITDSKNLIYLSIASVWEIVIKHKTGKLDISDSLIESIPDIGFQSLKIELPHVLSLMKIQLHHSDPFDRILISQAKSENLTLITADSKIWKYDINLHKVKS